MSGLDRQLDELYGRLVFDDEEGGDAMSEYERLVTGETLSGDEALALLQDALETPVRMALKIAIALLDKGDIETTRKVLNQLLERMEC